jgi:hypothetical protein
MRRSRRGLAAEGGSDGGATIGGAAASSAAGTGGGMFGTASNAGKGAAPGVISDAGAIDPGADDCVGEKQDANPVPVDMYIMLDRSDSMRALTGCR